MTLSDTPDLLLRAAVLRASVPRARAQRRRWHSHRTTRWLVGHLALSRVQKAIPRGLRRQNRGHLPTEPVDGAIDFHDRPYHGRPQGPRHRQVVTTKEERGTHRAHRFASLSMFRDGFGLVASLRFHPRNGGTLASVRAALYDFEMVGGPIQAAFLDRWFSHYAVLSW